MKQMFNPTELKTAAELAKSAEEEPSPLVTVARYEEDELYYSLSSCPEQYLEIHRAPKSAFKDSLEFWIACLGNISWSDDFGVKEGTGECKPLDESDWRQVYKYVGDFSVLPSYEGPRGRFVAAMMMRSEWNEVVALCETDQEYFAYFWSTGV